MTARMTSLDSSEATIRAAASLMGRCDGLWRDEHDHNNGWTIDYAVDVDVIKLFMAPSEKSQYANVFAEDDTKGTRDLLARMLGDFILKDLPGATSGGPDRGSLLIISPHDEELERMTLALAAEVLAQTAEAKNQLEAILNQIIEKNPADKKEFLKNVVDNARSLIEAFDGLSGPRRELNQLGSLSRKRLKNLARFEPYLPSQIATKEAHASDAILPPRGDIAGKSRDDFAKQIGLWSTLLKKHQIGRKPQYAIFGDAVALATIAWINSRIAKDKRKLVLITGSDYLFNAAEEMLVSGRQSFGHEYLRHPLGFVAEKDFFTSTSIDATSGRPPFRLSDWLNLFFPSALKKQKGWGISVDIRVLKRINDGKDKDLNRAVTVLAKNESQRQGIGAFPDDMLVQWANVIATNATLKGFSKTNDDWNHRVKEFTFLVNQKLNQGWTVDDFRIELDKLAGESLSNLYCSTSRFGVLGESKVKVRGLPALRFDAPYAKAQQISETLIRGMFTNSSVIDVEKLYADLHDMDPSNYHAHVIHALAFAGKGHWFATRTLCKVALQVVDSIPASEQNFRTGREAAYLLAIAERRLAQSDQDILKRAIPNLESARLRENKNALGLEDVRFLSESYSQRAITAQFNFFESPSKVHLDLMALLKEAEEIIDKATKAYNSDNIGEIKNWVIRQSATNCLVLMILDWEATSKLLTNSSINGRIAKLIEKINSNGLGPESKQTGNGIKEFRDVLSDFVYWVAIALFDKSVDRRRDAQVRVAQTSAPSLDPAPMPFEAKRWALFQNLAKAGSRIS